MKSTAKALTPASPAAKKAGVERPHRLRKPPSAGPTMNPMPKAAPTNPKFRARLSGALTSAM
ncbi:MAG: hypothetical protein P8188_09210 [Gemmatimonadota bacterium]